MNYTIKEFKNKEAGDIYDIIVDDAQNLASGEGDMRYMIELEFVIEKTSNLLAEVLRSDDESINKLVRELKEN